MDLIFYSYRNRLRPGRTKFWQILILLSVFCYAVQSWRISQKCPHGHYYNDGCTACWCDIRTGQTKCEKLLQCSRVVVSQVKCPQGRLFKDNCGNDCSCYESTGAVFCNEKRKCLPDIIKIVPTQNQTSKPNLASILVTANSFSRRDGLPLSGFSSAREPVKLQLPFPSSTSTNPPLRIRNPTRSSVFDLISVSSTPPPIRLRNPTRSSVFELISSSVSSTPPPIRIRNPTRSTIFDQVAVSSTPRPQFKIPGRSNEELIIEPAIIIRKKGSNKASVLRNTASATSVTLSTSNQGNSPGQTFLLSKGDNLKQASSYPSVQRSLAPLTLYEKQLKTIMDIKRAYAQLLGSKVNFNFQIATGKGQPGQQNTPLNSQNNNLPFNRVVVLQEKNDDYHSPDHPRRFDSSYDNSTILVNTTPSPPMTGLRPSLLNLKPLALGKQQIKNALKLFSPVPPLKQLVSYVSSSTDSYLSGFLHGLGSNNKIMSQPETTESLPIFTTPTPPTHHPFQFYPTGGPIPRNPYYSSSTSPVHEVYQHHDWKNLRTTTTPTPFLDYYGNINQQPHQENYPTSYLDSQFERVTPTEHTTQFPFMNELMQEIINRADHNQFNHDKVPTATPRTSPALTAVPTFQTPGPPYAEIDVVQPLSFLPPPDPEPATPTRRTFMMGPASKQQTHPPNYIKFHPRPPRPSHPTVRVNLDKPIYVPQAPQYQPPQTQTPLQYPPQIQTPPYHPPPPQMPHFHLPQPYFPYLRKAQTFLPQPPQQNRRNHIQQQQQHPQQYHREKPVSTNYFPPQMPPHHHPHYHPIQHFPSHQYFIPKPKQYRLHLIGKLKEAAVRVDDVVPRFVSKIAHEFFKKPDIYIPKIRPGKPLTLEKVVLNHREIVPKEVMLGHNPAGPSTKLRFTPEAHWQMKADLARQGIMLNEPLNTALRDYANNDPNVMEMDAPIEAMKTWETHTGLGMGSYDPAAIRESQQYLNQQQHQQQFLLSSTALPPLQSTTQDAFHQQDLQQQLLLAQQQQFQKMTDSTTSGATYNQHAFNVDPNDFNGFGDNGGSDSFPPQLNIPGVKQVVVDKYLVHDPMGPSGNMQVFTTTTVEPPLAPTTQNSMDLTTMLSMRQQQNGFLHRQGLAPTPTPPPAVLIRHHGAPSPKPPPSAPNPNDNYFFTVISTTPTPPLVTSTIAPPQEGIASQIQDFLTEQMDFGARPQFNLYDLLFHSRAGAASQNSSAVVNSGNGGEDQMATASNLSGEEPDVETENLASIFSSDYKQKHNRKPPEVIVIRVPPDHSDGTFPRVVERRFGQEIEIQGGRLPSPSKYSREEFVTSTESSASTSRPNESEEQEDSQQAEKAKRRRNRKGNKRKRKRKKKKKGRKKNKDDSPPDEENSDDDRAKDKPSKSEDDEQNKNEKGNFPNSEAEQKFQSELDWKSQLMANICDLNPSSPLCLTYRSICLLMTSDD